MDKQSDILYLVLGPSGDTVASYMTKVDAIEDAKSYPGHSVMVVSGYQDYETGNFVPDGEIEEVIYENPEKLDEELLTEDPIKRLINKGKDLVNRIFMPKIENLFKKYAIIKVEKNENGLKYTLINDNVTYDNMIRYVDNDKTGKNLWIVGSGFKDEKGKDFDPKTAGCYIVKNSNIQLDGNNPLVLLNRYHNGKDLDNGSYVKNIKDKYIAFLNQQKALGNTNNTSNNTGDDEINPNDISDNDANTDNTQNTGNNGNNTNNTQSAQNTTNDDSKQDIAQNQNSDSSDSENPDDSSNQTTKLGDELKKLINDNSSRKDTFDKLSRNQQNFVKQMFTTLNNYFPESYNKNSNKLGEEKMNKQSLIEAKRRTYEAKKLHESISEICDYNEWPEVEGLKLRESFSEKSAKKECKTLKEGTCEDCVYIVRDDKTGRYLSPEGNFGSFGRANIYATREEAEAEGPYKVVEISREEVENERPFAWLKKFFKKEEIKEEFEEEKEVKDEDGKEELMEKATEETPLVWCQGEGMMLPAFEAAMSGKEEGDRTVWEK